MKDVLSSTRFWLTMFLMAMATTFVILGKTDANTALSMAASLVVGFGIGKMTPKTDPGVLGEAVAAAMAALPPRPGTVSRTDPTPTDGDQP
jgi:hypothetical protein